MAVLELVGGRWRVGWAVKGHGHGRLIALHITPPIIIMVKAGHPDKFGRKKLLCLTPVRTKTTKFHAMSGGQRDRKDIFDGFHATFDRIYPKPEPKWCIRTIFSGKTKSDLGKFCPEKAQILDFRIS